MDRVSAIATTNWDFGAPVKAGASGTGGGYYPGRGFDPNNPDIYQP